MYFEYENHMLQRFRAMHDELAGGGSPVRLYALIDTSAFTWQQVADFDKWTTDLERFPLYAGSGLAALEQTGPSIIVMPDLRGNDTISWRGNSHNSAISLFVHLFWLARYNTQLVSWIWTSHDVEPFIDHLQTLMHARLGADGDDAWFFFYQPSYLRTLHRDLPEPTRRHVFGSCHAWWTLDVHEQLIELPGEGLPIPRAWDAFPVPADVVEALHRATMPMQMHAWLRKTMPEIFTEIGTTEQLREVVPFVERAMTYGLTRKIDIATFVAYGLHYKTNYDLHPRVQDALTDGGPPLIDRYMALGSKVWQQVEDAAAQRVEEERVRQWHSSLRAQGFVRMKVRLVNSNDYAISNVRIRSAHARSDQRQSVGSVDAGQLFRACSQDAAIVNVPLPGDQIVVEWAQPYNHFMRSELVVGGELPRHENAGVLVLRFAGFEASAEIRAETEPAREWGM